MSSILPNTNQTPATRKAQAFSHIGSRTLAASQVSKLREGNQIHHHVNSQSRLTSSTTQSDFLQMSEEQQVRTIDNEHALSIMPEIEWAARVVVSSITSPKDMTKRELIYTSDLDWLPPTVKSVILDEIKKDMEAVYNYGDSMYGFFKDALFVRGSHPRLVLPEAAVDRIINSGEVLSMESLGSMFSAGGALKRRGYFGPHKKEGSVRQVINMESFRNVSGQTQDSTPEEMFYVTVNNDDGTKFDGVLPYLSVTDNFDALKLPYYMESIAASERDKLIGNPEVEFGDFDFGGEESAIPTAESSVGFTKTQMKSPNAQLTVKEFRAATYKSAPNNMVTHLRVPGSHELKRRSVGRPLVIDWPPEAAIPMHVPGNVKQKLGYILLIDENGHPVSMHGNDQIIHRAKNIYNTANSSNSLNNDASASMILNKAARNLTGGTTVTTFREGAKVVEKILEDNIIPRLMNGAYPGGAEISASSELYMLMMARTLCSMHTRMVFVPAEMMSYFAFDYHHNGMGKSLLDSNKILLSMRAGLLLTRTTGEMRNSIPLTKITMKIDEDDADWEKTWSETQDLISKTRQPQFPLNNLSVNDMMDWIHRAGMIFAFEGHPRIPDTGFDFEKIAHENVLPSQDLYDSLGRQLYLGLGIPPELMDTAYDPEFATALVTRNIMFTQTILEYQKIASALMSEDHHRLILADGIMMNSIVGLVKNKWGEIVQRLPSDDQAFFKANPKRFATDLVKRIVTSIRVSFPSPDGTTVESQKDQLQAYKDLTTELLPSFVGSEVIATDIAPELANKIGAMEKQIYHALIRKWCADNNVANDLFQLSSIDEEGRPSFNLLDITESYTKGLATNFMSSAKALVPIEEAVVKDSETLNLGDKGGDGGGSDYGSSSGGGGDEFGGGFGDFGFEEPANGSGEEVIAESSTQTQTETTDQAPENQAPAE